MTVQELEAQLDRLNQDEKGLLFQRLALDLIHAWPGIEKTPSVHGGDAWVVRTRIQVWTLEAYRAGRALSKSISEQDSREFVTLSRSEESPFTFD